MLAALQDPSYRYTRLLYPLLAGFGGLLSPVCTLAGLVLVQVLAGGAAAAALAAAARRLALPAGFVVVNLFNPGVYSSACLLTCDLLAHALALGAWVCIEGRRYRAAAALFALALLAKEYYALTPLAFATALAAGRQWRAAAVIGVLPLLPVAAWKAVLTVAMGSGEGLRNFTWPGGGVVASAGGWDVWWWCAGLLGIALLAGLLAAAATHRLPIRLRAVCAAWGLVGLCTSELVWRDPADLLRAVLPAWWLAAWVAFFVVATPRAHAWRLGMTSDSASPTG